MLSLQPLIMAMADAQKMVRTAGLILVVICREKCSKSEMRWIFFNRISNLINRCQLID